MMEQDQKDTAEKPEKVEMVDRALYEEEVRKRKALEKKVEYLEKLLLKRQDTPPESHSLEKKGKTKEMLIQELKAKHKFAYNTAQYPWMYTLESVQSEQEKTEWLQEWSNFLLDYAKAFVIHLIDIAGIATEPPFSDFKQNRERCLKEIFNYMATKINWGEWYNREKTRLRIYWRSLEEWSECLFDYAYLEGSEIATLIDIKNMGERVATGFATLPAQDLPKIIDILVKNKKAAWIDRKSVKFHLI